MIISQILSQKVNNVSSTLSSNMAPAYKFTYFDGRGAGEVTRYIFKYGNIEFEDVRIKQEDWPKVKNSFPFGQLPLLEHNGKKINQSVAITRYVAKQAKLAGNDDWENLEIDAVVDSISDVKQKVLAVVFEKDEAKKKTLRETVENDAIPYYYSRLDNQVQKNNGYLVGGRLTWADFFLAANARVIDSFLGSDYLSKYSNLKGLVEKVEALPAIKKWIEERPKSVF